MKIKIKFSNGIFCAYTDIAEAEIESESGVKIEAADGNMVITE